MLRASVFVFECFVFETTLPNGRYFSRFQTVTTEASEGKHEAGEEHHTRAIACARLACSRLSDSRDDA